MSRDLSRLLRPRSSAGLGSVWAENVIEQCGKMGFAGAVWPVHPTRAEIGGLRTYPSVADLPAAARSAWHWPTAPRPVPAPDRS